MTERTYSLAEVAAALLPREWKNPELWLRRRLLRGEITGYKVGHTWRMRESDVEGFVASHLNTAAAEAAVAAHPAASAVTTITAGLSARAARRLRSVG